MKSADRSFPSWQTAGLALVACLVVMGARPAAVACGPAGPYAGVTSAIGELREIGTSAGASLIAGRASTPTKSFHHRARRHVVPEQGQSPVACLDDIPPVPSGARPLTRAVRSTSFASNVTLRDLPPRAPPASSSAI